MNKDTKHHIEFDSSTMKRVRHSITCLVDLPDEILLMICRYLSSCDILYAFYTPSEPEQRLHRMSFDYHTKIKIDGTKKTEYNYLSKLFSDSKYPLRPKSLIFNNERVTCLTSYYFTSTPEDVIHSMFENLKHLTLTNCTQSNLQYLNKYIKNLAELQYLHITIHKPDINQDMDYLETCNILINQLLFNQKQISSLHAINYHVYNGLLLNKSLISHNNLRNVDLVLQTTDDLYILLDGLVPNVQTMIIKLFQSKARSYHFSQSALCKCPQLREFTLFESSIEFVLDDIKSIFGYMTNLFKLTLSIHDTFDPRFCNGPMFESILNEYFPHLRQFHYTMTHQIANQILIKDFVRWPMNVTYYGGEHCRWIHIYSLPWPSSKNDKRQLPIVRVGSYPSVSSDINRSKFMLITKNEKFNLLNTEFIDVCEIISSIVIDIKLPLRISKVIFSSKTPIFSINSIIQPSVRHLIVERCLCDEKEMSILAHQFPHVKYLKLDLPSAKSSFINCLDILINRDDQIEKKSCYWSELIFFSTELFSVHKSIISNESQLYDLFIQYTNLKDKNIFDVHCYSSTLTIWY